MCWNNAWLIYLCDFIYYIWKLSPSPEHVFMHGKHIKPYHYIEIGTNNLWTKLLEHLAEYTFTLEQA